VVAARRIAPLASIPGNLGPLGVSPGATRFVTVALTVFLAEALPFDRHPAFCCPDFPHLPEADANVFSIARGYYSKLPDKMCLSVK